jgi:hypothetical protein
MLQADLDDLRQQVRNLTDRVARLEASLEVHPDAPVMRDEEAPHDAPRQEKDVGARHDVPGRDREETASPPVPETSRVLPILGGATLGLAGAYLLRAIAESGVIPSKVVFAVAALYAVVWLLWAPRAHAGRRLATILYSLTASLILSPLLWEATVRFHTVSPWQTSVILVAFTLIGLSVSWRKDLLVVATISTVAGIGTATALLIATDDVLPFTFAFLAIAAAIETCACFNHWLGERWLAAAAADLAVFLATWLVTNPRGLPEAYAPIPAAALFAAQIALLAIYLSSVMVRTLLCGRAFTTFETAQCVLAFVIGLGGAIRLSSEGWHLTVAIAGFVLLCGAACYAISFKLLARQASQGRNFYTYTTFGILLVLVGCRILLSNSAAAVAWFLLALACIGVGGLWNRLTLEIHGGVYLLLALLLSGALRQSARFLLGADLWPDSISLALWAGAGFAGASYLLARRYSRPMEGGWMLRVFRVVMAAALVWLVAGLAAGSLTGIYHGLFAVAAGDPYCATLRTGAVVGVTLLLAAIGSRPNFRDFAQLVYPLMLLGGYRLLSDDLRQDRKAALFLSLLVYGATLIALPRLRRTRANTYRSPPGS